MGFLMDISVQYKDLWLIFHLFAIVIGLGGATYTDYLLVSFLKDYKVDKKEKEVIHTMSAAVTVGLFLALLSGALLVMSDYEMYFEKSKFVAKLIIFFVLTVNGLLLHRYLLPHLLKFNFKKDHFVLKKFMHLRHMGFVMGAISGVSWYSVFILGALSDVPLTVMEILAIYVALLAVAIVGALVIEKKIGKSM